ncbi:MAG TPA: ATP-binding protein [Candidatus Acidoferrum sp.]|jgi:two-component system sensor histidine kinase KdpD|nr:ATP-binding protein [Candidatus Acidoferrum sp.]
MRRFAPYIVALAGVVAITFAIALMSSNATVPGLWAVYLLLVLWLAARWGRGPAVTASIAAFLLYDYFLVPPVGTFAVRGPSEVFELVVLLVVALVTSQLAASIRRARATSDALAADSRVLYELATAALRTPQLTTALSLVCERALALPSVSRFALVAVDFTKDATALAGGELTPDEVHEAAWAYESKRSVGVTVTGGAVKLMKTYPVAATPAYLTLASGVAVMRFKSDHPEARELRRLAALIGLADLLMDRRRAALESERARGLEASDKLKAAILSSLSHELKSPIASLRAGLTALLAPQAGLRPEQQELLVDLDRQATRLDRLVGDMLALSRLEAGLELDKEPHGFAELVGTTLYQLRADLKGHEVAVDLADDLPPVEVDELQVGRVLTNLIENALEWAPATGGVAIGAAARESVLEAWVENDGPEIAPVDLDRIFETFWTRRARGSGLGLAICKRVVEAHGGTIRAENRRRGPRFTFTLPLAKVGARP